MQAEWLSSKHLEGGTKLHSHTKTISILQMIAAPLAAGVLSVEPPYAFYFLLGYYFFGKLY
jgi:hypothetical protein